VKISKGLKQAYDLRDIAHGLATKLAANQANESEMESARVTAQLIRSWSEADDRVRIHRGKPLPGTLRPVKRPTPRRVRANVDPFSPKP